MNKTREYIHNTIILLIGKFVTQFMSLFLLPIYTHYLNTSDFGVVDLYQTYISLFVPIFLICMDSSVFRFLIDNRNLKEKQQEIVTTSFYIALKQVLIFIVIALIVSVFFKIKYIYLVILNTSLIMFSNVFLQICRGLGKNNNYSIACIITGFVTLILNIFLIIFLKFNASSILISSSIANLFCVVYVFFTLKLWTLIDKSKYRVNVKKEMLSYSYPLVPNALSWWIVNASDRTIISIFINSMANGIYTVSCKFSNILHSIFSIFTMSWQESASLHINDKDKDFFFSKMINGIYLIFVLISCILIFSISIFFDLLIGNEYISAYNYIPILIFANSFSVLIGLFGGIYIAKKMSRKLTSTTIISAIINAIINILLIKKIELYAACLSTLISYLVMSVYRYFDVQKYVKVKIYYKTIIISIICFSLSIFSYYLNNIYITIILFVVNIVILIISNKKMIFELINKYIKIKL